MTFCQNLFFIRIYPPWQLRCFFQVEASLKAVEEERNVLHNKFLIETESRKEMEGERVEATQLDSLSTVLVMAWMKVFMIICEVRFFEADFP